MDLYQKVRGAVGRAVDSGTHLNVAKATENIARKFGLGDRMVQFTHIELRNAVYEPDYRKTKYKERILFLPHCSRNSKECKAEYNEEGLVCKKCMKCDLGKAIEIAEKLGYKKTFIVPGGSMIKKLLEKYKPKASVGVCCFDEALLAFDMLKGTKVIPQVVLLLKDGCKDTVIDLPLLEEKLKMK
jgi:uncharacterized protein